ncbi:MAG: glutamate--tRNA ligase, partial [Candidatus Saccharimonas sp.]
GILPEAMLNFLAQLGWNDGTEQEIFDKEELIEKFSLDRVQKSGARFDEQRLIWLNGQWIRSLDLDDLYNRCETFWGEESKNAEESYKKQVLSLAQDRLKTLQDLPKLTNYFFTEPEIDEELINSNKQLRKLTKEEQQDILSVARQEIAKIADWTPESIQNCLNGLLETTGQKPGILFSLVRIVTTWAQFSPQLNDTLALIGQEKTLQRIDNYLQK